MSYATECDQTYFTGVILSLLALTVPLFWIVLRLNWNHVHKACIYNEETNNAKMLLNLDSLDDMHVCAKQQNVWLSALV